MAVCIFEGLGYKPAFCKSGLCGAQSRNAVESCCGNMCDSASDQILLESLILAERSPNLPVGTMTTILGRIALVETQTGTNLM